MQQKIGSQLVAYGVALLAVAAATLITQVLWPQIEPASTPIYFAAVMCAAWFGGLWPGVVASFASLLANDYFFAAPLYEIELTGANLVRGGVFVWVALLISLLNGVRKRLNDELRTALEQVKLLSGLLPVCSGCKMIRDEQGRWWQMEVYISEHSEARFSHGFCPDCFKQHYPQSYEKYGEQHLKVGDVASS